MFLVVNKDKIISYIIAFLTVSALLILGTTSNLEKSIQTSYTQKEVPIYSVDTTDKKVALTMNCAWNADDIDDILKILEESKVKITFFMVGDWVDKYGAYVKKIYEAGHEIANHSNTHPHVNNLNEEMNREEIKKCSQKIEAITGKKTTLYRGPYGEYNNTVLRAAKAENHITIQWSIDSLDYTGLTEKEMVNRIEPKLQNGSIILMHNGTKNTASSLKGIIKSIKEKGFNIVKVSDLIYQENYQIDVNGVQHQE